MSHLRENFLNEYTLDVEVRVDCVAGNTLRMQADVDAQRVTTDTRSKVQAIKPSRIKPQHEWKRPSLRPRLALRRMM